MDEHENAIVTAAFRLAATRAWGEVKLADIAAEAELSLADLAGWSSLSSAAGMGQAVETQQRQAATERGTRAPTGPGNVGRHSRSHRRALGGGRRRRPSNHARFDYGPKKSGGRGRPP